MKTKITLSLCFLLFLCLGLRQKAASQTLSVTINQKASQVDPASSSPVVFTVVFSAAINVSTFTASDIILSGTSTGTSVTAITQVAPNNGTTFEVTISAVNNGTVIATIPIFMPTYSSAILGTTDTAPVGLVLDNSGNIFTANSTNKTISKVTAGGNSTTTFASLPATSNDSPTCIIIDASNNLYVASSGNPLNRVAKITTGTTPVVSAYGTTGMGPMGIVVNPAGTVYTANYFDNNVSQITSAGSSSIYANIGSGNNPTNLALDGAGNIYALNSTSGTISKITAANTFAQIGTSVGRYPTGIALDNLGNIYTGANSYIAKTVISSGTTTAYFATAGNSANKIVTDAAGNVYSANSSDNTVSRMTPNGIVNMVGITGAAPSGIVLDATGNIYTCNNTDNNVSKLTVVGGSFGIALLGSTITSNAASTSTDNSITYAKAPLNVTINKKAGQASPATSPVVFTVVFSTPISVSSFTSSDILLSGTATGKSVTSINQVSPNDGTTFQVTVTATGPGGTIIAALPAAVGPTYASATLGSTGTNPGPLVLDNAGNVYTANASNTISKITATGSATNTFATLAAGSNVNSIGIDASNNLYTLNNGNNNVSKITTTGTPVVATLGTTGYYPMGMAVDASSGNVYVGNYYDNNVSKITPAGASSIFARTGTTPYSMALDGSGNAYPLTLGGPNVIKVTTSGTASNVGCNLGGAPRGIVIDGSGNAYTVSYASPGTVSKTVIATGVTTPVFATVGDYPLYVAVDAVGNIYTDNMGGSISQVTPSGISTIIANVAGNGMTVDAAGNVYLTNYSANNVTKLTLTAAASGIAISGSSTPSNTASTSSDNGYILPVTLVSFTVAYNSCTANLAWRTTGESNSSYFGVEYSADGTAFALATNIESKNNANGASYSYGCNKLASGTGYYRLKMVDKDGSYTYSKTISTAASGNCTTGLQIIVSPNPTSGQINIQGLVTGSHLSLIDAAGKKAVTAQAVGSSLQMDISKLSKGAYILSIESADRSIQNVKVVKQ